MAHSSNLTWLASILVLGLSACDLEKDAGPKDELGDDESDDESDETDGYESTADMGAPGPEQCGTVAADRPCDDGAGTQFCDWQQIDESWELIWGECLYSVVCMPGDQRECIAGNVGCEIEDGVPYWPECPFTPLALSFDAGPIELSASTAMFDIASVGECLDSDWPAASNPWLAIDLDNNGFIDGGHELFGSGSLLDTGRRASNGFIALASLDSNHDGKIDAGDARFDELLVWRDEDADKLSMSWELTSLRDEGVDSIDLGFFVREQCDARGNCERERSSFEFVVAGQRRVGEVVDVYLACP